MSKLSRRKFLGVAAGAAGAAGAGVALGVGGYIALEDGSVSAEDDLVPFYGSHQAGIVTPVQDRLLFATFDMTSTSRSDLRSLLQQWSVAAARMTRGLPVGDENANLDAPPEDTGEAEGLQARRLTITFGFGPSLFDDRFGLRNQRPPALVDLPAFPFDALDPNRSGGDLAVQVCSDDAQVAFHAVRNLARIGRGLAVMRWSQLGFGRTSSTSTNQQTLRNLMGFKDGTNNIKVQEAESVDSFVWAAAEDGTDWMQDGTYMVVRRIRMLIEIWDRSVLGDQEDTIGRVKDSGAPLGGQQEFDTPDLAAHASNGALIIPADAHIRLAAPSSNDGERILRRGFSFTDGIDPITGQLDAGLFFICFQRDPRRQFIPIQAQLAATDALNEYIKHVGSAIFACPPGANEGSWVGEHLFA